MCSTLFLTLNTVYYRRFSLLVRNNNLYSWRPNLFNYRFEKLCEFGICARNIFYCVFDIVNIVYICNTSVRRYNWRRVISIFVVIFIVFRYFFPSLFLKLFFRHHNRFIFFRFLLLQFSIFFYCLVFIFFVIFNFLFDFSDKFYFV